MSSPSQGRTGAGDMDISAGQKMMSATWGSVLTSVLGKTTQKHPIVTFADGFIKSHHSMSSVLGYSHNRDFLPLQTSSSLRTPLLSTTSHPTWV